VSRSASTLTVRSREQARDLPVSVRTLSFVLSTARHARVVRYGVLDEDLHHYPCPFSSQVPGLHGRSIPFKHLQTFDVLVSVLPSSPIQPRRSWICNSKRAAYPRIRTCACALLALLCFLEQRNPLTAPPAPSPQVTTRSVRLPKTLGISSASCTVAWLLPCVLHRTLGPDLIHASGGWKLACLSFCALFSRLGRCDKSLVVDT